jgi:hypothetical protein
VPASSGTGLRVEGARQLRASLKRAGLDVQDLKDAHRQVAEQVAHDALPATPHRTGALARSLRPAGTQTAAIVRAGRAAVPYAAAIHWGSPRQHIRPQPWIYNAAQRTQNTWTGTYLHALETIIDTIEGAPTP